ncbi:TraM recognition domain-containing protein [Mollicutes bacterium LVI A0039]|nr:TraM recognition domain-containing protein [Mollicutes bacterium LVI A0039]
MYRILFKDGYKTLTTDFEMFYKSCKSLFSHSFVDRNFKAHNEISYIVKCNKDYELEFYFDTKFKDTKPLLLSFLQTMFTDDVADVIEWDYKYDDELIYCNSITKYEHSREYHLQSFDKDIVRYILTAMQPNTQIQVLLYINYLDEFIIDLKVHGLDGATPNAVKSLCSTIQQNTSKEVSNHGRNIKLHVLNSSRSRHDMKVSLEEMLNFTFIPYNMKKIPQADIYTRYLIDDELDKGISAGYSSHILQPKREVRIPLETLRRHLICTGTTGAGKSSVLEEMILSIIENKVEGNDTMGFTLFDPKFGACTGVMNAIDKLVADGKIASKSAFMERVRYIDLNHEDCNFGINILDKDMDTTELINYFKQVFKSSGVQLERYITHAVNMLLRDSEEHTIADIQRLFEDEEYCSEIYERVVSIHGPSVRGYISSFADPSFKPEQISPILNRIAPFVSDEKKKRIFTTNSSLEIEEWFEKGYIVIFNLDGFSQQEIEMIVGYVSLKYYLYAMKRNEGAHSHFLIVDEAHDVQIDIFEKIIAKTRSRGLHLWLFTQYLQQLKESLLKAVVGNMSTKIILQQGEDGAKSAHKIISLPVEHIIGMPKMSAYLVTENEKNEVVKTLIKCKPPYRYKEGKIMPYSDPSKKIDKILKENILRRNDELRDDLIANMIKYYPRFKSNKQLKFEPQICGSKILSGDLFL